MLRPLVAFTALCLVAFLLAPTVASLHDQVDALHIKRDNVWHLWKWTPPEAPPVPPDCQEQKSYPLDPEVTVYTTRMSKDQPYTLGGVVRSAAEKGVGVPGDRVEVFLNATKEAPGRYLGDARTDSAGQWKLQGTLPFELQANHYHVVAHALDVTLNCKKYHEGWSDPEVNVTARARLVLQGPFRSVAGHPATISGTLVDDVGGPITSQTVRVNVAGQSVTAVTDGSGRFVANLTPLRGGQLSVLVGYDGNPYYTGTSATATLFVTDESLSLNGIQPNGTLIVVRSTPLVVNGEVVLRANATYAPVTLRFSGILVRTCDECPPTASVTAPVRPDGKFNVTLLADRDQTAGNFSIAATGGGLRNASTFHGSLMIPTSISLVTRDGGPLSKAWSAGLVVSDDVGVLAGAPITLDGPSGHLAALTNATGGFATSGEATACGSSPVVARYAGTPTRMPTQADAGLSICGAAVAQAASAARVPWWVWPLLVLAPLAAWIAWRKLRERFAATISEGPPLTLAFAEPRDAAQGVSGLGEATTLAAFLESPLPEGHRLRLGTPLRMEDATLDPEALEARMTLVPDAYGDVPVRAEILDARGRVVTRRTSTLRVVRYGEEIERRYQSLRADKVGPQADRVSPREFEAWLRQRSAGLDPDVARRLVGVFEEADYGPRVAGRRELLAYLDAEAALPEVMQAAME